MRSEVYTAMARSLKATLSRQGVVAYVYHTGVNKRLYVRIENEDDREFVPKEYKGWDVVVEVVNA